MSIGDIFFLSLIMRLNNKREEAIKFGAMEFYATKGSRLADPQLCGSKGHRILETLRHDTLQLAAFNRTSREDYLTHEI